MNITPLDSNLSDASSSLPHSISLFSINSGRSWTRESSLDQPKTRSIEKIDDLNIPSKITTSHSSSPKTKTYFNYAEAKEYLLSDQWKALSVEQKTKRLQKYFQICPIRNDSESVEFFICLIQSATQLPCTGYLHSLSSLLLSCPFSNDNKEYLFEQGIYSAIKHQNHAFVIPWIFTLYRSAYSSILTRSLINDIIQFFEGHVKHNPDNLVMNFSNFLNILEKSYRNTDNDLQIRDGV